MTAERLGLQAEPLGTKGPRTGTRGTFQRFIWIERIEALTFFDYPSVRRGSFQGPPKVVLHRTGRTHGPDVHPCRRSSVGRATDL